MNVELYQITPGDNSGDIYWSDSNANISYNSKSWLAKDVKRREINADTTETSSSFTIEVSALDLPESILLKVYDNAGKDGSIIVYDYVIGGAATIIFQGSLSSYSINHKTFTMQAITSISKGSNNVQRAQLTAGCILQTYGIKCGLNKFQWRLEGLMTAVTPGSNQVTITITAQGNLVFNPISPTLFNLGRIIATATGEERMVVSYSVTPKTVFLNTPFSSGVVQGSAYIMYAGDNKSMDDCENKFFNITNFVGFPWAPYQDLTFTIKS